jgi:hypothetical protein
MQKKYLHFAAIAFCQLETAIGVLANNSERVMSFKAISLD